MKKVVSILVVLCISFCINNFSPLFTSAADLTVNFDDEEEGTTIDETKLGEEFIITIGTPDSSAVVEKDSVGGNQIALKGYTDIKSVTYFDTPYTFSVDLISNADNTAVFVKSVEPDEYIQVENPKNQNVMQTFNYYEWDWYQENGGTTGASSIGGSGIYIMPSANTIKLGLKIYQEDGLGVSTKIFDLPAPEGYKRGEKCTIKVEDAITSVSISVNGTALAVVELSEPGTEYKTDDPVYGFYKKAVVKNAAGEELGTAENTRICSEYSQIAITTRNVACSIDNVSLHYEEADATEPPVNATETPATETPGKTETSTTEPTKVTSKATKDPINTSKAPVSEQEKDNNTPIIIAIVAACVVVAAGIVAAVIIAKKKKKSS
jgi:hypothetical protein